MAVETHLMRAEEYFFEGNFEAAKAACLRAIEAGAAKSVGAEKCLLGRCLIRLEEEGAEEALLEGIELCKDPAARGELARIYTSRGQFDVITVKLIDEALELDPDNADAYIARYELFANAGSYLEALSDLKRGLRRGAEYSQAKVFERLQLWTQNLCDEEAYLEAFELSNEVVDYFNCFEFFVLNARLAELADKPRVAVQYYKKSLAYLRAGKLRLEILESIAKLAE